MEITVISNDVAFTFDTAQPIEPQLKKQGYVFMDSFDGRLCEQRLKALRILTGCFPVIKTETTLLREKEQMEMVAAEIIKKALYWAKKKGVE